MTTFRDLFGEPVEDASDEPFTYHGEELTDAAAERINQETLAEVRRRTLVPGGKSLSGDGSTSPKVEFRVSRELRDALDARAAAEGVTATRIARQALEQFLNAS